MKPYTYLIIDLGCIIIPLTASFYPKYAFYREWKYFLPANGIIALFFLIWDFLFTQNGVWGFNPDYLTGVYIGNLPLEEVLFFICIPYACVFTYFALSYLIRGIPGGIHRKLSIFLILILAVLSLFSTHRAYTFVTFSLIAVFLLYCLCRKKDLSYYYLAYFAIFPFFLISNAMLPGTGVADPIVWYNNEENLGIRLGTIPVEDTIYGMLLIFLNIDLYRMLKKIRQPDPAI